MEARTACRWCAGCEDRIADKPLLSVCLESRIVIDVWAVHSGFCSFHGRETVQRSDSFDIFMDSQHVHATARL